MKESQIKKTE